MLRLRKKQNDKRVDRNGPARNQSMIPKKPAPHLMRDGHRFSEKDHAPTMNLGEGSVTHFIRLICVAALAFAFSHAAGAQSYPSRSITLVVPFAPGGPADFLGRLIGQKLSENLGQQIIVDNRPGANTIIGAQAVAKAKPDGYTLLMAIDGTLVMNP